MLTRPRDIGVDDRLDALVDPDLERRIVGENPEFFKDPGRQVHGTVAARHAPIRIGLILLGCALALGLIIGRWDRASDTSGIAVHSGAGATHLRGARRAALSASEVHAPPKVSPSVRPHRAESNAPSLSARRHAAVVVIPSHRRLVLPAAASRQRLRAAVHIRHATAPAVRPLQETVNAIVEQEAQEMEAARAEAATNNDPSSDATGDVAPTQDASTGRHIPVGGVWSDASAGGGAVAGGTIPISVAHGPMGGGGGSCPRGH